MSTTPIEAGQADVTDDQIRAEVTGHIRAEIGDRYGSDAEGYARQIAALRARQDVLADYSRPSRRQRIEREVLADQLATAERAAEILDQAASAGGQADGAADGLRFADGRLRPDAPGPSRPEALNAALGFRWTETIMNARRVLDRCHRAGLPAAAAERTEDLLVRGTDDRRYDTARLVNATGSETYERAFARVLRDPAAAHVYLSDAERDALAGARQIMASMGVGTDSGGGFAVPYRLDPSVILTSDGTTNPIRALARTVVGPGKEYDFVTSEGVVAAWTPENAAVTDGSPVLDQPSIKAEKMTCFVPFSVELEGDWTDLQAELGTLLRDAAETLDAEAFAVGTGTGQPTGVVTALAGTSSEVTTATAATLALADLESAQAAVPPRFRGRAAWAAHLALIQAARRFEVVTGVSAVTGTGPGRRLLDDPLSEASQLDGGLTTTGAHVAVVGDWQSGYVIYDRLGTMIEVVPHLFGSAQGQYPTGRRGLIMWRRVGADVVNANALRLLTIG